MVFLLEITIVFRIVAIFVRDYNQRNGEVLYVQVTLELSKAETIEREFGNLLRIKDNYPKVVVSGERSFENIYEGIEHIYIRDFLSSTLSHSLL